MPDAGEDLFQFLTGVSFDVTPGEVLGIVGESGCGTSLTVLSVMRLLPEAAVVTEGQILHTIEGMVPTPGDWPAGCRNPRCPYVTAACTRAVPELTAYSPSHSVACVQYEGPRSQASR
ncbi:ATP-binding cassette domain-containing protein [Sinorhizobium kostiense]|uniref:ATP-binding cassette domain-containing protein n=1 Tax=Sinorhizobium kostiense TaxID=76747 RepID=UPI001AEB50A8